MSYYNESVYLKLGKLWIHVWGKPVCGRFAWEPKDKLAYGSQIWMIGFHKVSWLNHDSL